MPVFMSWDLDLICWVVGYLSIYFIKRLRNNTNTEEMTILGKPLNRVPVVFVKECGYVPSVLCNAEGYIDKHIETKELFQVQGCSNKVTSLLFQLSSPKGFSKLAKVDVHDVIEAVKTFLVAMPEPLLADDVCDKLIEASQTDNNLGAILAELRHANPSHFAILHFMMRLLGKVADPNNKNGMDIRKLATIFVLDILKPLKIDDNSDVPISFPTNRMKRLPYLIMVIEHLMEHLDLFKAKSTSPNMSPARLTRIGNRCHSSHGQKFLSDSSTRLTVRPVSAPDAYQLGSLRGQRESDLECGDHILAPMAAPLTLLCGSLNPPHEKDPRNAEKHLHEVNATINNFKKIDSDSNIIASPFEVVDNGTKYIAHSPNVMGNTSNSGTKTVNDSSKIGGNGPRVTSSVGSKNVAAVPKTGGSKVLRVGSRFAGGRSKFVKCDSKIPGSRPATDGQVAKIPNSGRRSISSRARLSTPGTGNSGPKISKHASSITSKILNSSHNLASSGSVASSASKGVSSSCTSGMTNSEISELVRDIVDLAKQTCLVDQSSPPSRGDKHADNHEASKSAAQEQKSLVKTNLHKYSPNLRLMKSNSKEGKSASTPKHRPQGITKTSGTQNRSGLCSQPKKKLSELAPPPKIIVDKLISNKNKIGKKTVDAKRWMGNHPSRKSSFNSDKRPISPRSSLAHPKKIKRGKKKNTVSLRPSASDIADFSTFQPGEEIGPWLHSGSMSDTNMDISVLNKTIQQPRVLTLSPGSRTRSDKYPPKNQENSRRKKKKGDIKWKSLNIQVDPRSPPRRRDSRSPCRSSHSSFYSVTESPSRKSMTNLRKTSPNVSRESSPIVSGGSSHDLCRKSSSLLSAVSRRSSSLVNKIHSPVSRTCQVFRDDNVQNNGVQVKTNKCYNQIKTEKPTEKVPHQSNVMSPRKKNKLKQRSTEVVQERVSRGSLVAISTLDAPQENRVSNLPKIIKSPKTEKKIKGKVDKPSCPKKAIEEPKTEEKGDAMTRTTCATNILSDHTDIEDMANRMHSTKKRRQELSKSSIQLDDPTVPLQTGDKPLERASSLSNIQELLSCSSENARLQHPAAMPLFGKPGRVTDHLQHFGYEAHRRMFRQELARRKHERRSPPRMCAVPSSNVQRCVDIILIVTFLAMACFVVFELFRTKQVE